MQNTRVCLFSFTIIFSINSTFAQSVTYLSEEEEIFSEIISPQRDIKINEIMASNLSLIKDEFGEYDDWIELYNYSDEPINLNGLYISDSRKNLTKFRISEDIIVKSKDYVILWADEECTQGALHTSFKLDGEGESLYISDEDLVIIDSVKFGVQTANVSFGRLKNDFLSWNYFTNPSPGKENPGSGLLAIVDPPAASHLSGTYNSSFCLNLTHYDKDVTIRYTLNGDVPDESSAEFTKCIPIDQTTVVRYRSFKTNCIPGTPQTRTFFLNEAPKDLDVISITAHNIDLTGSSGIFTTRNSEVEKAVHIEYFGNDGKMKFNLDGGVKLHSPKANPQLSLCLLARSDYGYDDMNARIFPEKNIWSFNRLILRNGGNDGTASRQSSLTHFRDGLHHVLFEQTGNKESASAYNPVNVYINGKYFGIYNARERIDRNFIESNFGYSGEMDLLEFAFGYPGNRNVLEGSYKMYDSINSFMKNNDISMEKNYRIATELVDVEKFIDYWIHEVYIGNFDWLCNNVKIFRPSKENARFRWLLWDTDHGSGLPYREFGKPEWKTLQWSLSTDQIRTTGGAFNVLQRNFVKNTKFRAQFINRYADLLNTVYSYNHIENVIDSIRFRLQNDIKLHCQRWGVNYDSWLTAVDNMKNFHKLRAGYVRNDIMKCFQLNRACNVTLRTNDQKAGRIKINTILPAYTGNEWEGIYFSDVPVTIEAIPEKGYQFVKWENASLSESDCRTVYVNSDTVFKAVFSAAPVDLSKIIINEICYSSPHNGDWIEIANHSGFSVSLKDWKLSTGTGLFVFGDIEVKNGEYLLVEPYKKGPGLRSTSPVAYFNNFDLRDAGCTIKLFDPEYRVIDSVAFKNTMPWPELAAGNGFTLELWDIRNDNSLCGSWRASIFLGGTPGEQNSLYDDLRDIAINEFMALNDDFFHDEYWESDDWIELYNRGNKKIDIRGMFITDNDDNPIKYQIPNTADPITILPGEYLLLWADDQTHQGPLHLNFKLGAEGEEIAIFQNTGYEIRKIDGIKFGAQNILYTFGREYDGVGNCKSDWTFMPPTPKSQNGPRVSLPSATDEEEIEDSCFSIYPVPAANDLYLKCNGIETHGRLSVEIFNILGIKQNVSVSCYEDCLMHIGLDTLKPGLYIINIYGQDGTRYTHKFIRQ